MLILTTDTQPVVHLQQNYFVQVGVHCHRDIGPTSRVLIIVEV